MKTLKVGGYTVSFWEGFITDWEYLWHNCLRCFSVKTVVQAQFPAEVGFNYFLGSLDLGSGHIKIAALLF